VSSSLRGEILRFLVVGALNTILTTVAFYLLSLMMSASLAFTIVYAGAIVYLVLATPRYVFGARMGAGRSLALAGWYVVVYLVGQGVIRLLEDVAELNRLGVTIGTVAVTSPLSFIGARLLVRHSRPGSTPSG
jgi:putative flippase GtrA